MLSFVHSHHLSHGSLELTWSHATTTKKSHVHDHVSDPHALGDHVDLLCELEMGCEHLDTCAAACWPGVLFSVFAVHAESQVHAVEHEAWQCAQGAVVVEVHSSAVRN